MAMDFQAVLKRVADDTRQQGIQVLLVGGWALNAYGVSRQTVDIDFVCTDEALRRLDAILAGCGYSRVYQTDIVALAEVNKLDMRSEEFRALCLKFGTQALYDQVLTELGG